MDYERIEDLLHTMIRSGASVEVAPLAADVGSRFPISTIVMRTVRADETLKQQLRQVLKNDVAELRPDATWLRSGEGSGHRVKLDAQGWADTLIRTALRESPGNAIAKLRKFIEANSAPCHVIWLLTGVSVKQRFHLTPQVELVPYEELPDSSSRRLFQGNIERVLETIGFSLVPSCGLVLTFDLAPVVGEYEGNPGLSDQAGARAESLYTCFLALTSIGPSCPILLATWSEIDLSVPGADLGAGHAKPIGELVYGPWKVGKLEEGPAAAVCQKLLSAPQLRRQLAVPLERLGLALRRAKDADRAIELGIALEALLANDRSSSDPIAHLVRLRGALYLGSDLAHREQLRSELREAYNLRSRAVHDGEVPSHVTIGGNKIVTRDFIWRIAEIVAAIARKMILAGKAPDWSRIELGEAN